MGAAIGQGDQGCQTNPTASRRGRDLRRRRALGCGAKFGHTVRTEPFVRDARSIGLTGPLFELAVDQDEAYPARLVRPVGPGVVGAALDDHVARLAQHLGVVEHHPDLAGQDDAVIDRLGAVHQRMRRRVGFVGGMLGAELAKALQRRIAVDVADPVGLGRELDDAADRAVGARLERDFIAGGRGVVVAGQAARTCSAPRRRRSPPPCPRHRAPSRSASRPCSSCPSKG